MLFLIFLILYIFVGICIDRIRQRNHREYSRDSLYDRYSSPDVLTQTDTILFWPIKIVILIIKLIIKYMIKYADKLIDAIYNNSED